MAFQSCSISKTFEFSMFVMFLLSIRRARRPAVYQIPLPRSTGRCRGVTCAVQQMWVLLVGLKASYPTIALEGLVKLDIDKHFREDVIRCAPDCKAASSASQAECIASQAVHARRMQTGRAWHIRIRREPGTLLEMSNLENQWSQVWNCFGLLELHPVHAVFCWISPHLWACCLQYCRVLMNLLWL